MDDDARDADFDVIRERLRALPRTASVPPELVASVGRALRTTPPARDATLVGRFWVPAAATAAALLIGVAIGRVSAPRAPALDPAPRTAARIAMEVQRTGSAYAAAVSELSSVGATGEQAAARSQGVEAALATLFASALAYRALEPENPDAQNILVAIREARQRADAATVPLPAPREAS